MIKAVVTDVDGVIVGTQKAGYFPNPSPEVIKTIKEVKKQIPIILCSGKPSFGLLPIIKLLSLNNLHIATNGGVIFNPFKSEFIVEKIKTDLSKIILQKLLHYGINTDFVGKISFFHLRDKVTPFIKKLSEARFSNPILVNDIIKTVNNNEVVRIDVFVNKKDRGIVEEIIAPYLQDVELNWTTVQFDTTNIGLITPKGVSKSDAFKKVVQKMNIQPKEILGIGDGMNDWSFMKLCGQIGIMGNAQKELFEISKSFGLKRAIGGHVDKNGVVDIFNYFQLIS